jgi:hypothetical protein
MEKNLRNKYIEKDESKREAAREDDWWEEFAGFKSEHRWTIRNQLQKESELCRNPLNLYILCMLINDVGMTSYNSRSILYKDLHAFFLKKAKRRMQRSEEALTQSVLRPLYRIAHRALMEDRCFLTEGDLEGVSRDDLCASGFVLKQVRVSRCYDYEESFAFSHKTFVEFLCAMHMKHNVTEDSVSRCGGR